MEYMVAPLVSIVVPCYKQAQYLPDMLNSVMDQTYQRWECIVINDASPDNTVAIVGDFVEKDKRITLLNKSTNEGLAAARNSGILKGNGDYIVTADADDKLHRNFLEKTVSVLAANKQCKLVYTALEHFGERSDTIWPPDMNLRLLCQGNYIRPIALFRKSAYLETKGYRKNVFAYEDWDFWLQLIKKDKEAIYLAEVLYYQRVHLDSMIYSLLDNKEKEKQIRLNLYKNNRERIRKYLPELAYSLEKNMREGRLFRIAYKLKKLIGIR